MVGNAVAYTALSAPGDVIMSAAQPLGGHSSNRLDGPAGVMGRKIVDIPMDPTELVIDVDAFRTVARASRRSTQARTEVTPRTHRDGPSARGRSHPLP